MAESNDNYAREELMEEIELTDDDSMEEQVFHPKIIIKKNHPRPQITSEKFQSLLITSDESEDEGIVERTNFKEPGATSIEKENVPSSNSPKVLDSQSFSAKWADKNSQKEIPELSVTHDPQSANGSSNTGIKRFFRWTDGDSSEASTSCNSKKRPCTSPINCDNKRKSIESNEPNRPRFIKVLPTNIDGVEEIDPHCGCSPDEDVGQPAPMVMKHHRLEIAGVKVDFPLQPYPAQKAVMNALIKGCTKMENVLIESPTGSGKTLALLCGALAWQSHYAVNYQTKKAEFMNQMHVSELKDEMWHSEGKKINESPNKAPPVEFPKPIPKIYYCSRTHRQIAQVVKELGRTIYRDTKMTILSSREFSCIQSTWKTKTELCNELLDPAKKLGCVYYSELNRRDISSFSTLDRMGFSMPFDLEEFVKLGRKHNCCPYFAARNLMPEADLILCPYNYLIDPSIRKTMQIDITDAIIILDEAHNIEDICRDIASVKFNLTEIEMIIRECEEFTKQNPSDKPSFVSMIYLFCESFASMIRDTRVNKGENQSEIFYSQIWKGVEFFTVLDSNNMEEDLVNGFIECLKAAIEHHHQAREDLKNGEPVSTHSFTNAAVKIFDKFIFVFAVLRSHKSVQDFRFFVKEITEWVPTKVQMDNQFKKNIRQQVRTLEIHSMNPAVIFSPIAEKARSVILASGTLSPIVSFASELGTEFKHTLQTNHVIPKENVNIRVIDKGPQGKNLRVTYQNSNDWMFLDELGRVIRDTCQSVPHGVLCFLSSYALLHKVTERMQLTGTMKEIEKIKIVCIEPRTSKNLEEVMTQYRQTIKACTEAPEEGGINGAILFAVFRGKVAEGIDFCDAESRAVMVIGIPFAVYKDPVVQLKIQYNDQFKIEKNLLKGYDWYTIQAFRALNQALGRCIRHIGDWSSVLLVDERFNTPSNRQLLPKWVKNVWNDRSNIGPYSLCEQLKTFSAERTKADELKKAKLS